MPTEEPADTAPPGDAEPEEQPDGVFGNLPRTRPGARSPRRDVDASRGPAARTPGEPGPSGEGDRAVPPPPRRPAPGDSTAEPPVAGTPPSGGIEDVAWAGVAAAAEAATIGVRLATRALEAMRDAVDRR